MEIKELIIDLSTDPFSPRKNFDAAVKYQELNQIASAVSFYLRAAEYGFNKDPLVTYNSLIKLAECLDKQKDRDSTVSNYLLQAIAYWPSRPEAYFLLSRFYEQKQAWQECYTFAEIGLMSVDHDNYPLLSDVDYPGEYGFIFEQAVSGWWIGRRDESIQLFSKLVTDPEVSEVYKASARSNLKTVL